MNTEMQIQIQRCESVWMSVGCYRCHQIIWQGEESRWDLAKVSAVQLIDFLWHHQCRGTT